MLPVGHIEAYERVLDTPEQRAAYAVEVAHRYEIDEASFVATLSCESIGFTWNDQSQVIRKDGTREPSWGLAQFYMPSGLKTADGREITKDIALDPEEAIDAAGYNFSIGNASQWTCFKNLHSESSS